MSNRTGEFGVRLKFIIGKKFTNQKIFAEKFNINFKNLSNWITGRGQPDYETLAFLAECLDESIDWLLTGNINHVNVSSHFDLEIWDEVVDNCLKFAKEHNFTPTGRFFMGIYQSFLEEREGKPTITVADILKKHKSLILSQKK